MTERLDELSETFTILVNRLNDIEQNLPSSNRPRLPTVGSNGNLPSSRVNVSPRPSPAAVTRKPRVELQRQSQPASQSSIVDQPVKRAQSLQPKQKDAETIIEMTSKPSQEDDEKL